MVAFLLAIIMSSLFFTLTRGEFCNTMISAKTDLQLRVRMVMDWIVKDVRQTNLIQINSNTPTQDHIKFKQVTGIDNTTGSYTLSSNYIEYNYDSAIHTLTRNEIDSDGTTVLRTWSFDNIMQSPFYSDVGFPLTNGAILTSKRLIVIIEGQNQAKGAVLDFSLTEGVKIRNE